MIERLSFRVRSSPDRLRRRLKRRGVVRLAGKPPTLCFSSTIALGQLRRSPTSTIALVSATISSRLGGWLEKAEMNAASSTSE